MSIAVRFSSAISVAGMLLVSCGGGGDEREQALKQLPRSALATMVLPAEDLGSIVDGFNVGRVNGAVDNAGAAERSLNPDDRAQTFRDAGRVTGYELGWVAPDPFGRLERGEGIGIVQTEVDLFETADDATKGMASRVADIYAYADVTTEYGSTAMDPTDFEVPNLGEAAMGVRLRFEIEEPRSTFFITIVYFRIGRLQAGAWITAADDRDLRAETVAIARRLEERIWGVALGEIDENPVKIPN